MGRLECRSWSDRLLRCAVRCRRHAGARTLKRAAVQPQTHTHLEEAATPLSSSLLPSERRPGSYMAAFVDISGKSSRLLSVSHELQSGEGSSALDFGFFMVSCARSLKVLPQHSHAWWLLNAGRKQCIILWHATFISSGQGGGDVCGLRFLCRPQARTETHRQPPHIVCVTLPDTNSSRFIPAFDSVRHPVKRLIKRTDSRK